MIRGLVAAPIFVLTMYWGLSAAVDASIATEILSWPRYTYVAPWWHSALASVGYISAALTTALLAGFEEKPQFWFWVMSLSVIVIWRWC